MRNGDCLQGRAALQARQEPLVRREPQVCASVFHSFKLCALTSLGDMCTLLANRLGADCSPIGVTSLPKVSHNSSLETAHIAFMRLITDIVCMHRGNGWLEPSRHALAQHFCVS